MAQSTQVITLRISEDGRGGRPLIDTTFVVQKSVDVDALLEEIKSSRLLNDQGGLSTVLIIRDLDKRADEADLRPNPDGPRPMLGVYLDSDNQNRTGVRITRLIRGGGARDAGLQAGDVIVAVDGKTVRNSHEIAQAKESFAVGETIEVTYLRDGERQTSAVELRTGEGTPVVLNSHSPESRRGFMGVYTDELHADQAEALGLDSQQGVYLEGIVPGSGAEQAGLKKGDVITGIDGRNLDAAYELSDALTDHSPGDTIAVAYWRDGRSRRTDLVLTERISHRPKPTRRKRVQVERAYLGVYLDDKQDYDRPGARITRIVEGEAAEAVGLQPDDRIVRLDGRETRDYEDLSEVMGTLVPEQRVNLRYLRDGEEKKINVTLGSRLVHRWVTLPDEADVPAEDLVKDIEDANQADQLRQFMESPSLDMDKFEVFPNPSQGRFTVRFSMAEEEDTDVRIFTTTGQEIYRERLRNFSGDYEQRIDLREAMTEGVYFLQITRNGKGVVERLSISN